MSNYTRRQTRSNQQQLYGRVDLGRRGAASYGATLQIKHLQSADMLSTQLYSHCYKHQLHIHLSMHMVYQASTAAAWTPCCPPSCRLVSLA